MVDIEDFRDFAAAIRQQVALRSVAGTMDLFQLALPPRSDPREKIAEVLVKGAGSIEDLKENLSSLIRIPGLRIVSAAGECPKKRRKTLFSTSAVPHGPVL